MCDGNVSQTDRTAGISKTYKISFIFLLENLLCTQEIALGINYALQRHVCA